MSDTGIKDLMPVSESDRADKFDHFFYYLIAHYIQLGITSATFMYGVTSWCLIKKFRTFNNYVYVNVIFVNFLRLIVVWLPFVNNAYTNVFQKYENLDVFVYVFLLTVFNYWLVVMCYMFYVDIVKVFHNYIKRRYLYSFLFAWGVPSTVTGINRLIIFFMQRADVKEDFLQNFIEICNFITCSVFPAMINLVLFIKLLYSLFPCSETIACTMPKKVRRKQKLSRLFTATAMFVVSNIFVLTMLIWELLKVSVLTRILTTNVQILLLALFVPLLKSNRVYWHEYLKNLLKRPCRDYYCCVVCR